MFCRIWAPFLVLFLALLVLNLADNNDKKQEHEEFKARLKVVVKDQSMRDKIERFLGGLPISEKHGPLLSKFNKDITGGKRATNRFFGIIFVAAIIGIANAVLQVVNKQNELERKAQIEQFNRQLEYAQQRISKMNKLLSETEKELDEEAQKLEKEMKCKEKCRNYCELYQCPNKRDRCPKVPEDPDQCTFTPNCEPRLRCKLNPLEVAERETRRMNRRGKVSLRLASHQDNDERFNGARSFYRYLSITLGDAASHDAREIFHQVSKEKVKPELLKDMHDILVYFKEIPSGSSKRATLRGTSTNEFDQEEVESAIAAILGHLMPDNNVSSAVTQSIYSRDGCLSCFNFCPWVFREDCSFRCRNNKGCVIHACSCPPISPAEAP